VPHASLPRFSVCRCGHRRDAHKHYRPGSDCGLCACTRFRARLFGGSSGEGEPSGDGPRA
jgi:hypothetical protein